MLQAEYILPLSLIIHRSFLPEAGVPIQFLHRSCAKETVWKSDQSTTKSFPLNQSKYMSKLLVLSYVLGDITLVVPFQI